MFSVTGYWHAKEYLVFEYIFHNFIFNRTAFFFAILSADFIRLDLRASFHFFCCFFASFWVFFPRTSSSFVRNCYKSILLFWAPVVNSWLWIWLRFSTDFIKRSKLVLFVSRLSANPCWFPSVHCLSSFYPSNSSTTFLSLEVLSWFVQNLWSVFTQFKLPGGSGTCSENTGVSTGEIPVAFNQSPSLICSFTVCFSKQRSDCEQLHVFTTFSPQPRAKYCVTKRLERLDDWKNERLEADCGVSRQLKLQYFILWNYLHLLQIFWVWEMAVKTSKFSSC